MPTPPLIRPLTADDVPVVVEFSLRAWAPVFASFRAVLGEPVYEALFPEWRTAQAKAVEDVCREERTAVWVADVGDRAVGFVGVRVADGEIHMLAVDPEHQRRGIGTALTGYAVERLRAAGVVLAVVGTGGDPGHAAARATYEKAGFTPFPQVQYYKRLDRRTPEPPALDPPTAGDPMLAPWKAISCPSGGSPR
ncbi:GNAT family N-acetyltransferase [Saccharothrix longispora]|uniref:Ribosomal protein S18 acetylase RimI-like enzyme n=1 Tax=Saccharothrix longispora TaxID=33920 RepID=A0ABU1Q3N3_9PSEU|nr:GNAT family N-acetyltransferase [Saccharothrix longispora]MDR6597291.1 ribosomal protein S18 acetylase RimI-like enzyme [Saccharothrix longispora]